MLSWLQTKDCWELGELEYKLAFEYDVVYQSKQSYYNLFDAASISWKKTVFLESAQLAAIATRSDVEKLV